MNILEIKDIKKSFNEKVVLDGVSFTIKSGKIVGLLGKNGSGKSTIIKLVNDLLTVDSGEIKVLGNKVGVESKNAISYLPERNHLDVSKKVKDIIKFYSEFYSDFDVERAEKLLQDLSLDKEMPLKKMSKGMREKVLLVLVMSRRAKLYVLDEPLGGVDPSTREYILKTILSNFDENSSLLITTHLVSDVENVLDEVIIIDEGKVLLFEEADALREKENLSINEVFKRRVKWLNI